MTTEEKKRMVGIEAVIRYVRSGMCVGLGTGSTAAYAVTELAERQRGGFLSDMRYLVTSVATGHLATRMHMKIEKMSDLLDDLPLDIVIDGADAVDSNLNLIKGAGGALLREKVVAYNCQKMVVIIDENKIVSQFDSTGPVIPLEVLPHAHSIVIKILNSRFRIGGAPLFSEVKVRPGYKHYHCAGAYYITDNGNMILDAELAQELQDVETLEHELNHIPGLLENGLFTHSKPLVLVGSSRGLLQFTNEGLKTL